MPRARPSGDVSYLFTDIVGSTKAWREDPESMAAALESHDRLARSIVADHDGWIFATAGDSFGVAFRLASQAVQAAVDFQLALGETELRARIGLHTGTSFERDDNYFGPEVNLAARIMAVAHGGQIVSSARSAELAGVEFVDLGDHLLKDMGSTVALVQVRADGLETDFPPLNSLDRFVSSLPVRRTSFVGRTAEVDVLAALLQESRLVTVWGAGGAGKSSLAVRTAESCQHRFPDGVYFADLAPARGLETVVSAIVSGARLRPRPDAGSIERVTADLRERRCMLVLDNCEQVVDDVAEIADAVLEQCRSVTLLATSRRRLDVAGERLLALGGLDDAGPDDPAVELFLDRAHAAHGPLDSTEQDTATIRELVTMLDRLPLAIELAAARTTSATVSELASDLSDSIASLRSATRGVSARHLSLDAAIDSSRRHLSAEVRRTHDRLSVFRGSFDRYAAATVTERDPATVSGHLEELIATSLLQRAPGADTARFAQLQTIRQHAKTCLESARPTASIRHLHLGHYHWTATALWAEEGRWPGPRVRWWALAEQANLVAAMEHAVRTNDPRLQLLACSLTIAWKGETENRRAALWMDRALAMPCDDAELKALMLALRAWVQPFDRLVPLVQEARAFAMTSAPRIAPFSAVIESNATISFSDPLSLTILGDRVRAAAADSPYGESFLAWALHLDGLAAWFSGRYDHALDLLQQSLRTALQIDPELPNVTWTSARIAHAQVYLGVPDEARAVIERARSNQRHQLAIEVHELDCILVWAYIADGEARTGDALLRSVARQCGPEREQFNSHCLLTVAHRHVHLGNHERARTILEALGLGFSQPGFWEALAVASGHDASDAHVVAREQVDRCLRGDVDTSPQRCWQLVLEELGDAL